MKLKLNKYILWPFGAVVVVLVLLSFIYFFQYRAPSNFPDNIAVTIHDGKSLTEIAADLEKQHIIRSPFWFNNFVIILKRERRIVGGVYYFDHPMSVYQIAKRLTRGTYNVEQLKTTIPEGSSVPEIGNIIKKKYPEFDQERFVTLAEPKEGYLFPDTYLLGASPQSEKVIEMLTSTFDKKMQQPDIQQGIASFGRPLKDIINMASILEGEARQTRTRRIVAGILWERIRRGIPLQVDATFKYINGKGTKDLTLNDLKIDSPYNTYVYKGLPPGPISSPGLDSIMAAMSPIATDYLYFLTDKNGNMHYAETFEEHTANKRRYISN